MNQRDMRPPFAALGGTIPPELEKLPTPCYLLDEDALTRNAEILGGLAQRTGCKVLLAQKAFSNYDCYPLLAPHLAGTEASGLFEARLGAEEMPGKEGSRLGTTRAQWNAAVAANPALPNLLDGLHFHTLCEQNSDALATTLDAVAQKFGDLLPRMQWLNFGGGHHITRPGYDIAMLERCITRAQQDWGVTVYLEPGEACALNAGFLLSRVLDVVQNGDTTIAILDASAACHMPDVIEMPYRPPLFAAAEPGEKPCTVRLAGPTCLAGDVIGDYGVDAVPNVGDLLVFGDMAIYTTCKNNTFNGMPLPAIFARAASGTTRSIVSFGYEDFKYRLGKR